MKIDCRQKCVNDINFPNNCVMQSPNEFLTFKLNSSLPTQFKKMNVTEKKGNWHKQTGALKQKFASLMENDQLLMEGKKQELFGKFQISLGQTRVELQKILAVL